jgi:hypothetical protein
MNERTDALTKARDGGSRSDARDRIRALRA